MFLESQKVLNSAFLVPIISRANRREGRASLALFSSVGGKEKGTFFVKKRPILLINALFLI
jgi:hypothetical protein